MDGSVATLEVRDFTRGFVAALVMAGESSLQPMNPSHRRGLYRVYEYLDEQATRASADNMRDQFKALVRIRNRIAPGPTGAFDQFQTDLRDLQLSLTESPNPSYEDISFSLSQPFARSLLGRLGASNARIVEVAVEKFLGDRFSENVSGKS